MKKIGSLPKTERKKERKKERRQKGCDWHYTIIDVEDDSIMSCWVDWSKFGNF